jgi:hypothetical protein
LANADVDAVPQENVAGGMGLQKTLFVMLKCYGWKMNYAEMLN